MNHTDFQPDIATTAAEEYGYLHIVAAGRLKTLIRRYLRRAPRALCGELLWGDPDRPGPHPCSPYCPACVAVSGLDEHEIDELVDYVPEYWIEDRR
ncbi:hypothetical protein [Nocardia brasiliensis]|uniref:hypothetical protein n=1 Tax=Nocardia brasiliensis TaxID=37326 RepID=UPI002454ECFE|nr:hypothetical protein [Nocardia brasiliensis]